MASDILISNNDFIIENGDFKVGISDFQHFQVIINSQKGEFKQFPIIGVGIESYLNSNSSEQEIIGLIRDNLTLDKVKIVNISFKDKVLNLDANY